MTISQLLVRKIYLFWPQQPDRKMDISKANRSEKPVDLVANRIAA